MPNIIQILRNSESGVTPVDKLEGEPFVNYADKSFGVWDDTGPVALLAIRFFSPEGLYVVGDLVVQGGKLWRCIGEVTLIGPFVPANWEEIGGVGTGGGGDMTAYVLRSGDTMLGPLTLVGDPAAPMEPVTLRYLDDLVIDAGEF
jgi:hypothetical protein